MSECRTSSAHPSGDSGLPRYVFDHKRRDGPSGAAPWVVCDHKRDDVRRADVRRADVREQALSVGFAPALKHCEQCIGAQPKLGGAGTLPMLLIRCGSCQPGLDLGSDD
jgi:hypothetical protein